MTVLATIRHWQDRGLTPDEALAGMGIVTGRTDVTWVEVRAIAEIHERRFARQHQPEEVAA